MGKLQTGKLIVLFLGSFAATSLIPTQVLTMENYSACVAFYFAVFITTLFLGDWIKLPSFRAFFNLQSVLISSTALVAHITLSQYVRSDLYFDSLPIDPAGASFLLMNEYFIWAKPFDVLAQQSLILIFYQELSRRKLSLRQIQTVFIIAFGAPHIFKTLLAETIVGAGFTVLSFCAALLFPYLLRNGTVGAALCFFVHLLAYSATALIIWSVFSASDYL